VLSRHVSVIDTLLPVVLLPQWRPRYVLKRELLWDPCLDVVGQRVPNAFVRRGASDTAAQLDGLRALAEGMTGGDMAAIFPEGTRFSPGKRARLMARLAERGDADGLQRVQALRHLLPPRWAGAHALVAGRPDADILLLFHTGLEGITRLDSLLSGDFIGRTLRVDVRRVPADEVPRDPERFAGWLWAEWRCADAGLSAAAAPPSTPADSPSVLDPTHGVV
jgi:1-acyl-sn-glycerol-3-phosphate acyltransferase